MMLCFGFHTEKWLFHIPSRLQAALPPSVGKSLRMSSVYKEKDQRYLDNHGGIEDCF